MTKVEGSDNWHKYKQWFSPDQIHKLMARMYKVTENDRLLRKQESKRTIPVRTSSIYGHRPVQFGGISMAFHGRAISTNFYSRNKINVPPDSGLRVAKKELD